MTTTNNTTTCAPFYRVNHDRECDSSAVVWCDADPMHEHTETVFGEVTCAHCFGAGGYETAAGRWGPCTSCNGRTDHSGHHAEWAREGWARNARMAGVSPLFA